MVYRRQESFRYTFNNPIPCKFKIKKINDHLINSDFGDGQIMDISPHGVQLLSSLNIPVASNLIEIEVQFSIDHYSFEVPGTIVWQKASRKNLYSYGVKLVVTTELENIVIDQLKKHAKNSPHTHHYPK